MCHIVPNLEAIAAVERHCARAAVASVSVVVVPASVVPSVADDRRVDELERRAHAARADEEAPFVAVGARVEELARRSAPRRRVVAVSRQG